MSQRPPSNPIPIHLPTYPFAPAPDIIRANQKDTSIQLLLQQHLSTILRQLYGSRFAQIHAPAAHTLSHLLYLGLTTLIGNRTLGEEYCNLVQITVSDSDSDSSLPRLPAIGRRAGYIVSAVLVPYILERVLPGFRSRVRRKLEEEEEKGDLRRRREGEKGGTSSSASTRDKVQAYILENLSTLTSPSPLYALMLSLFYFTGSYYHLSKRLFGLRYIFTKRLPPSEQQPQRAGYEVLGVLLVLQMAVQAYLHLQKTLTTTNPPIISPPPPLGTTTTPHLSQYHHEPTIDNDPLLLSTSSTTNPTNPINISIDPTTQTPLLTSTTTNNKAAWYDLHDPDLMTWIPGRPQQQQQRKCTLCLEAMKDPSVTTCGHVFCWSCIGDWVREKPECPLCRQGVKGQHVLPLRG